MKLFIIMLFTLALNQAFAQATAEAYLQDKIAKKEIELKNLKQTFEFESKKYKVSDFDNLIGTNLQNTFLALNLAEAKQYAQNYIVAKSYVLKSKTESLQKKKVLDNLNRMFAYIYGEEGEDELDKSLQCTPEQAFKPIQDIVRVVQESKKTEECKTLKTGEHKVFVRDDPYTSGDYLLRKDALGNFQAVLNVEFIQAGGSLSASKMLAKAKSCLTLASSAMKGPNGEMLQLSVLSPSEIEKLPVNQRPAKRTVKIEGPQFQTDAENYNEKVDCDVITHEMLHLLGLCDEYKENREKYKALGWNCRVITKVPSLMKDLSVFSDAVPKKLTCECTGPVCKTVMESTNTDLKSIFLMKDLNNVVPYDFRLKYCKINKLGVSPNNELSKPYTASSSDRGFRLEAKEVGVSYSAPFYTLYRNEVNCVCPQNDVECLREKNIIFSTLKKAPISKCPVGSKELNSEFTSSRNLDLRYKDNVFNYNTTASLPSLLQPGHFNKILHGNCPGPASKYNECSKHAYLSDKPSGCKVPVHCTDDNYYLGAPQ
jgi:hypothetical protein